MSARITRLAGTAFLAFPEMNGILESELSGRFNYKTEQKSSWYGDLLFCPYFKTENQFPYWARAVMEEPFLLEFESIGEAARSLKEIQRNWAPYTYQFFRRAALIQEKLPYINLKTRNFTKTDENGKKQFALEIPKSAMGLWTLTGEKTIIASAKTPSFLPAGTLSFAEDHENPPSRAYLKLQESLTLTRLFFDAELPNENSKCFEAGACPGGWTWVLRELGAEVFAVDRAELAPRLMSDKKVSFMAHDAFTLKPEEVCEKLNCEKADWVFSDVICYPERLFQWVNMWLESGRTKNMICTIKMQGETDWNLIQKFAEIPHSKVVHLNYNKHELTWINCFEKQ